MSTGSPAVSDRIRRPSSQFYWADHFRDPALRACSLAAQGLWMLMLDLMHQCEPYGHLRLGGAPESIPQLARQVGESRAMILKLLAELETNGVFSRTEDGTIYSRRMVRDEHLRTVRAEVGKLGGNPNLKGEDKHKAGGLVKQNLKQNPTPSSSSSSSSSSESGGNGQASPQTPRDRFLERFYSGATPARKAEVIRQLYQALQPEGARLSRSVVVRASSQEHLNGVISEVLRDPPKKPDSAIVIVLKKLGDCETDPRGRTVTEAAAAAERDIDRQLTEWQRAREKAVKAWSDKHPQQVTRLEEDARKAVGDNPFALKPKLLQDLTKAADFPEFDSWSGPS